MLIICVPMIFCIAGSLALGALAQNEFFKTDEVAWDGEGSDYSAMYLIEGIDEFVKDFDRWPTNEEGIAALSEKLPGHPNWDGPYIIEDDLKDWWGNDLHYEALPNGYRVTSYGEDNKPGGRGEAADIVIERRIE